MFKRLLFSLFFLSFIINGISQNTFQRKHIDFDNNWKFAFGNSSDPEKDFKYGITNIFSKTGAAPGTAIDPRLKDGEWRNLNLSHDWAVELPFVNSPDFDIMAHGYK